MEGYLVARAFRSAIRGPRAAGGRSRDPSEAQIRDRSAAIRATWSDVEQVWRSRRWGENRDAPEGWTVPLVLVADLAEAAEIGPDDLAGILNQADDSA